MSPTKFAKIMAQVLPGLESCGSLHVGKTDSRNNSPGKAFGFKGLHLITLQPTENHTVNEKSPSPLILI